MRNITVNANLNLKEQPQTLYVHGSIMTYSTDDVIELKKAKPQGINSSILVLDLKVISGDGPKKGIPKHFNYINSEELVKNYTQITIRYSIDSSITINIEILG
jgi:hypothetical protein